MPPANAPDLIIYGGAFDPPHAGHVDALRRALTRFPEAKAWVMPSAAAAVAGSATAKAAGASFDDREAMCRIAFEPLGSDVAVSRLEAEMPAPNYTVETLRRIREQQPRAHLGLLIGRDQVSAFPRWREPDEIRRLATLIAVGRDGTAVDDTEIVSLPGFPPPAESRKIRASLAAGERVPDGWLDPAVATYIEKHALYAQKKD